MRKNQATAAQARFVESLAKQVDKEVFEELFKKAFAVNGNAYSPYGETIIQGTRRLTKTVVSQLIDNLLAAKEEVKKPAVIVIDDEDYEVSESDFDCLDC